MDTDNKCKHEYDRSDYTRADGGYYLDCIHCKQTRFFQGYGDELFDIDDDFIVRMETDNLLFKLPDHS